MVDRLKGKHLKSPLRRGFSLMDWMRLCQNAKDLAGRQGKGLRPIAMAEVRRHSTEYDCWTVLRGKVYNITPYLHYHPGSKEELFRGAGRDCTELFDRYHRWVNAESMLEACLLGWLDNSAPVPAPEPGTTEALAKAEAQAAQRSAMPAPLPRVHREGYSSSSAALGASSAVVARARVPLKGTLPVRKPERAAHTRGTGTAVAASGGWHTMRLVQKQRCGSATVLLRFDLEDKGGGGGGGDEGEGAGAGVEGGAEDGVLARLLHVDVRVGAGTSGAPALQRPYTPVGVGAGWLAGATAGAAGASRALTFAVRYYADAPADVRAAMLSWRLAMQTGVGEAVSVRRREVSELTLSRRLGGGVCAIFRGCAAVPVTALGMVSGGSGVTPFVQLLRALEGGSEHRAPGGAAGGAADGAAGAPALCLSLVACYRSAAQAIMRDELQAMAGADCTLDLSVTHVLTEGAAQPAAGPAPAPGRGRVACASGQRLDSALLREALPAPDPGTVVVVCGPPAFNEAVRDMLLQLGHEARSLLEL
eukprot:g2675.t1